MKTPHSFFVRAVPDPRPLSVSWLYNANSRGMFSLPLPPRARLSSDCLFITPLVALLLGVTHIDETPELSDALVRRYSA